MRLSTVRLPNQRGTAAARLEGDELVLLPYSDVGELLASGDDWPERAAAEGGERIPLGTASLAPVIPHPNKIVCLGLNYATHIKEMGRLTPAHPTLFAKYDGSLVGANDNVVMPAVSDKLDWEAELGVVIGHRTRHVTADKALAYVGGYTVVNDVTVRDWQHRTREFLSGKTFESTTPVGPSLVTPDELPRGASGLAISCSVDGHTMQKSNTSDLLFDVASIIAYVSTIITLQPGDLIATGTPGGVGAGRDPKVFLQPGQELVTVVEGVGELRNIVAREEL
ncbi:fumarylacetoacetate hydrolase family protein [Streptomyces sp. NBC_01515]|uniref:fumarylacetoacetate hydrolase family protein n=1 Tax=Streptomyces sp. NBC_01515 TaxID=2903890 RepID=UPI003867EE73